MKPSATERSLFEKLDKKLRKDGQHLKKCNPSNKDYGKLGRYYIVDEQNNAMKLDIDLEDYAREFGCMN